MDKNLEIKKFYYSLVPGFTFVIILWFIKLLEIAFDTSLHQLGIYPRAIKGLTGIVTSPLIHSDLEHLLSNSFPLIILSAGIIYFYPKISFKVFGWIYIATGIWVWAFARNSYHIGASGLVYGFASFLFFSGIFRRSKPLMAISLLVIFLYGGMIWGVLPFDPKISFESHLLGGIMGLIVAYSFRKDGLIPLAQIKEEPVNYTGFDEEWIFTYELKPKEKNDRVEKP